MSYLTGMGHPVLGPRDKKKRACRVKNPQLGDMKHHVGEPRFGFLGGDIKIEIEADEGRQGRKRKLARDLVLVLTQTFALCVAGRVELNRVALLGWT